MEEVETFVNA